MRDASSAGDWRATGGRRLHDPPSYLLRARPSSRILQKSRSANHVPAFLVRLLLFVIIEEIGEDIGAFRFASGGEGHLHGVEPVVAVLEEPERAEAVVAEFVELGLHGLVVGLGAVDPGEPASVEVAQGRAVFLDELFVLRVEEVQHAAVLFRKFLQAADGAEPFLPFEGDDVLLEALLGRGHFLHEERAAGLPRDFGEAAGAVAHLSAEGLGRGRESGKAEDEGEDGGEFFHVLFRLFVVFEVEGGHAPAFVFALGEEFDLNSLQMVGAVLEVPCGHEASERVGKEGLLEFIAFRPAFAEERYPLFVQEVAGVAVMLLEDVGLLDEEFAQAVFILAENHRTADSTETVHALSVVLEVEQVEVEERGGLGHGAHHKGFAARDFFLPEFGEGVPRHAHLCPERCGHFREGREDIARFACDAFGLRWDGRGKTEEEREGESKFFHDSSQISFHILLFEARCKAKNEKAGAVAVTAPAFVDPKIKNQRLDAFV